MESYCKCCPFLELFPDLVRFFCTLHGSCIFSDPGSSSDDFYFED